MKYVELRAKSNFSFLTGASHPDELVAAALQQNLGGIAITDLNGVYGMPRGYRVLKYQKTDFKYICGTELTLSDHDNVTLLARNREAYGKICQLVTYGKQNQEKGALRLSLQDLLQRLEKPQDFVVLPRVQNQSDLYRLKEKFQESLYLPLTIYLDGKDRPRVKNMLELAKKHEIKIVASNDVEYHSKERKALQDVMVSIREGKSLQEVGFKLQPNAERYIKSLQQLKVLYRDFPEALPRTVEIAESCTFSPEELKYRYPSEWIPEGHTAQSYLEHLVWSLAPERYKNNVSEAVKKQLLHELKLIRELNFADYFLTIYDIVAFARSKDILCQGRGSAANSAVCYVLGITAIDPLKMELLFERFLSAERGEPPDIDIDFEHERREEVIQYIYEKYGRHRAAMVSAVITYQYRSAFREVAKAFGVPVGTLSAKKVQNEFAELTKDHPEPDKLREKIEDYADKLQGFPRHLSIHSGGFTLSADPITDIVPVEPARMEGRTIIQWDKYDLDTLGLIKVDVLSLGMLSCLQKTIKMTNLQLHEIPQDDPETYEMIQHADTVGVFQIESRAQMQMLGRLKPRNFYELVIEVSIVRPGPIVGDMVHPYLRRRRGLEKVVYPNQKVESILGKTLGVPLFQEQVMRLAIDLANFTPGESDTLRKSINAWRSSAPVSKMGERLMQGLLDNGMSQEFAETIFKQIQGFSHYGFPESHAASFALLAYASCYFKKHHPAEFACALINSQPLGFYRNDTILYDALRHGVKVKPVSVLHSEWDCKIEESQTIRLGFRVVAGLAKKDVDHLVEERKYATFKNLSDFLKRTQIRKDVLHRLALAGRLGDQDTNPREALWALLEYENLLMEKQESQMSFFKDTEFSIERTKSFAAPDNYDRIEKDYEAFSLSTHGHPMLELRRTNRRVPKMNSKMLKQLPPDSRVKVAGLVLFRQKPPTAKGTCFATLEDEFGFVDTILWKKIYDRYREVFMNNCFVIMSGRTQKDENTTSLLVDSVQALWPQPQQGLSIEPQTWFWG